MLKISIDFSAEIKDQFTTNGIRVLTDTSRINQADLVTALGVCTTFRRTATIPDKMIIEINGNDVKLIPTDQDFRQVKEGQETYVPLERVAFAQNFFKDLRKDIMDGIQDHLKLDEEKSKIKVKSSQRSVQLNPDQPGITRKRWKR